MSLNRSRLSSANLSLAAPSAARPGYKRDSLRPGIVHLGIGAFHRAHQAVYTDAALAARFEPWGIVGVSLRSPGVRDQLMPQDGLYAVLEKGAQERLQIVGSVRLVLFAPDDIDRVVGTIADPAIRIVSLTVTEKGYLRDPATGKLKDGDPDVQHDIDHPGAPRSTLGVLVRGLERRKRAQAGPLTVLCCDNLP
ncbi:MAG: mannitol dehydrogenase family protein, partial [Alphaproteobacteria bacterium]|nr:mannitol dehydrogenase family protein [Alphaproteobacteria bacterium]